MFVFIDNEYVRDKKNRFTSNILKQLSKNVSWVIKLVASHTGEVQYMSQQLTKGRIPNVPFTVIYILCDPISGPMESDGPCWTLDRL